VQFTVGKDGQVLSPAIVQGASPVIDAAVGAAVHRLPAGRPQYCEDPTPRPYLEELSTTAVRQALAQH
jgi:hypothetical protein